MYISIEFPFSLIFSLQGIVTMFSELIFAAIDPLVSVTARNKTPERKSLCKEVEDKSVGGEGTWYCF